MHSVVVIPSTSPDETMLFKYLDNFHGDAVTILYLVGFRYFRV